MFRLFSKEPLMAPVDDTGGNAGAGASNTGLSGEMSHEDMIEFMAEDDDKETIELEDKDKKKEKPKEKEPDRRATPAELEEEVETPEGEEPDDDELAEIEAELEEPSEEQLELVTPVRRREILKKYPNLFKDFPYLEKAYYREQQFTELLPTIEDAKTAVEKAQILDRFEGDVLKGNTETLLKAVRETNPNGFLKIVDEYLPTLAKVDEKAYFHVLGNVTKHTIMAMVNEARRLGTEENQPGRSLQAAAHLLNQFVFGTTDFKAPTNLSGNERPEENTRERQIQEREQTFVRQQFDNTRTELNTRVNNTLRNTIDANIDPKQSMSDYVRKNASRDALDNLETLINQDNRFKTLVDKLWEQAFKDNFSKTSVDRIRSAYVSKAKTLLPSVIKKARNEALRGMGKRVSDDTDSERKRGPVPAGRPRSQESRPTGKVKEAKDIPKGMSTLEFLNSE